MFSFNRKKNIKLIMDECLRQYDSIMRGKCAVGGDEKK